MHIKKKSRDKYHKPLGGGTELNYTIYVQNLKESTDLLIATS